MSINKRGKQSFILPQLPVIHHWASVAGKKESEGPLAHTFDVVSQDTYFGQKTWEQAEKRMLDTFPRAMLKADVLKLGHHGSASSTGFSFFLAVDPDFAVASCGTNNDFGHPHSETLSLLHDTRTAFYSTDTDGTVVFRLDGNKVSVDLPLSIS